MDINALKALGITETEPREILNKLEEIQLDIEQRLERVEDEERLAQLRDKLGRVEEQLKAVRKEMESIPKKEVESGPDRKGAIPIAVDQSEVAAKKSIPVAVTEEEKKAAAKNSNVNANNRNIEKEQAKKQQQHEDDLKRQAKELSSKMKDKKKQEEKASAQARKDEEKKAQEAKKAASAAGAAGAAAGVAGVAGGAATAAAASGASAGTGAQGTDSGSSSPQKIAMEKKLHDGVKCFFNRDFANARKMLEEVANLGDDVGLEDKDIGIAEHLVGVMHKEGLGGIKKDEDRAVFWFERSAKHNNVDGCMEYAMYFNSKKSTTANEVRENVKKSLKYFKKAASLGSKDAKTKYIKLVEMQINIVSFLEMKQAIVFIDEFIADEQDEFIKKTWRDRKKAIRKKTSASGDQSGNGAIGGNSGTWESVVSIIGSMLILIGYAYMCKSVFTGQGYLWSFDFLPDLNFLNWTLRIDFFEDLCYSFVYTPAYTSLAYGIVIAMIGSAISAISKYGERGTIANIFCEACFFVGAFIAVVVTLYGMKMGVLNPDIEQAFVYVCVIMALVMGAKAIPYIATFF